MFCDISTIVTKQAVLPYGLVDVVTAFSAE